MSGNGRGTMRPQGRTPPFLIIGLLVVLCILGYSFWNASSKSSERAVVITHLQDELQSLSERKLAADRLSSDTNTKLDEIVKMKASIETRLRTLEMENEELKNQVNAKGDELQNIQNELASKKDLLKRCDDDSTGIQQELQKLKEETESLKQEAANRPAQCDQKACEDPIRTLLNILVNSLGRPQIMTSLQNNPEYKQLISPDSGNPQAPDAPVVNPDNPQQPVVNPDNPQQPVVNQGNQYGQAPAGNPADQGDVRQVQPPQESQLSDGNEEPKQGEHEEGNREEEEDDELKFNPQE